MILELGAFDSNAARVYFMSPFNEEHKTFSLFSLIISIKINSRIIAFDSNAEKILFCFVLTRNTLNKSWKIKLYPIFLYGC